MVRDVVICLKNFSQSSCVNRSWPCTFGLAYDGAARTTSAASVFTPHLRCPPSALRPTPPFNPNIVALLEARSEHLTPGQCYSYKIPPVLGGSFESTNVQAISAIVHFTIMGQLHEQTRNLPPGTKISHFKIVEWDAAIDCGASIDSCAGCSLRRCRSHFLALRLSACETCRAGPLVREDRKRFWGRCRARFSSEVDSGL
jgi:hypothetical protein